MAGRFLSQPWLKSSVPMRNLRRSRAHWENRSCVISSNSITSSTRITLCSKNRSSLQVIGRTTPSIFKMMEVSKPWAIAKWSATSISRKIMSQKFLSVRTRARLVMENKHLQLFLAQTTRLRKSKTRLLALWNYLATPSNLQKVISCYWSCRTAYHRS